MAPHLDAFVPVTIANKSKTEALSGPVASDERVIEIRFPNGILIRVSNAIEVEPLRRVLTAVAAR